MRPYSGLILIFLAAFAWSAEVPVDPPTVMSFRDWKSFEVRRMKDRVAVVQNQLSELTDQEFITAKVKDDERKRLSQKLSQTKFNLEVMQELSVNDYFILYLSRMGDKRAAFVSAASKLSPSELAELLMAYDKQLSNSGSGSDLGISPLMGDLREKPTDAPTL